VHARGVRLAEVLVVLLVVPDAIESPAAGADQAADQGTLARALASAGDRTAGRADRRAAERADASVLADVPSLVRARTGCGSGLGRRLAIARAHDLLGRHTGALRRLSCRGWS